MTFCWWSVCLFSLYHVTANGELPMEKSIYPYVLTYKLEEFEGDIYENAPVGTKAAMKGTLGYKGYLPLYLEVEMARNTNYIDGNLFRLQQNSSGQGENRTRTTSGMECIVRGTTRFTVNDRGFILLQRSNESRHELHSKIYFYVVMIHKEDGAIVSNPLSFIVEVIEDPNSELFDKNAITSGILVVLILVVALFTGAAVKIRDLTRNKDKKCRKKHSKNSIYDIESDILGMDWKDHYHIKPEDSIIMEKDEETNMEVIMNGGANFHPPLTRMDSQISTLSWLSLHFEESECSSSVSSTLPSSPPRNHGIPNMALPDRSETRYISNGDGSVPRSGESRRARKHGHKKRKRRKSRSTQFADLTRSIPVHSKYQI